MEHDVRVKLAGGAVAVALVVGLSVVTSTVVASRAYQQRGKHAAARSEEITVRGSARRQIVSDLAVWKIRVRGRGVQIAEAYAAVEAAAVRAAKFLEERGFSAAEVQVSATETETQYKLDADGDETHDIDGYEMDRVFTVTTGRVGEVAKASAEVTQLLQENVQVFSGSPSYLYTKLPDLRLAVAGDAAKDARARAAEVATKSGSSLGEVRQLSAGPIQVTTPNSTEVSGSGSYDTSTIEKDVSVTVLATFGIGRG